MPSADALAARRCQACTGQTPALSQAQIDQYLTALPHWRQTGAWIERTFRFSDYEQVMRFVNAVADLARETNHHPVMEVGYRQCIVRYTTHAIGALSENDFICAARVEALTGELSG
jgi:4a-hydroxytetrahydrobiopterin dehydratase